MVKRTRILRHRSGNASGAPRMPWETVGCIPGVDSRIAETFVHNEYPRIEIFNAADGCVRVVNVLWTIDDILGIDVITRGAVSTPKPQSYLVIAGEGHANTTVLKPDTDVVVPANEEIVAQSPLVLLRRQGASPFPATPNAKQCSIAITMENGFQGKATSANIVLDGGASIVGLSLFEPSTCYAKMDERSRVFMVMRGSVEVRDDTSGEKSLYMSRVRFNTSPQRALTFQFDVHTLLLRVVTAL